MIQVPTALRRTIHLENIDQLEDLSHPQSLRAIEELRRDHLLIGSSKRGRQMEAHQASLTERQIKLTPAPGKTMPTPKPTDLPPIRPVSKIPTSKS